MIHVRKILFPVDFSDRCRGTAHVVRAFAQRFGAEVTLLFVAEPASGLGARKKMEQLAGKELDGCKLTLSLTTGDPAVKIVEHARTGPFDLIMMPTHGFGPFRRYLLGSVTAKVLHDAGCPVWTSVHLEDWPAMDKIQVSKVLCGIDFGIRSVAALQHASAWVSEFKAELTVAHAIPHLDEFDSSRECREHTRQNADAAVRRMEQELGISAPAEILDGSPASALSEAAERLNSDLLVIGRTHAAAEPAKLGSDAYAIISHSPCPVLSV